MPLRLSYNANGLRHLPLLDAIDAVAGAGYDGIELSLHQSHLDPVAFVPRDANPIVRRLEETGIVACCLATGADRLLSDERFEPSLINPEASGRDRRVALVARAGEIATALGVPIVSIASGTRKPDVTVERAWALLEDGVARCLEAVDESVVLALEPEPGFLVETNGEAAALVRRIGSPRLRVNQDVGHANVVEDDYLQSIERTLPITAHVHVEDIKGRVHRHEVPGDGDIDFRALLCAVHAQRYGGFLSVELYDHCDRYAEALRRSRDVLVAADRAAARAA